jgi:hypothetical protein
MSKAEQLVCHGIVGCLILGGLKNNTTKLNVYEYLGKAFLHNFPYKKDEISPDLVIIL